MLSIYMLLNYNIFLLIGTRLQCFLYFCYKSCISSKEISFLLNKNLKNSETTSIYKKIFFINSNSFLNSS